MKIRQIVDQWFIRNKTVNNASWLIGGKILQMLISFFVGILTARFLGPSNFGVISRATAFVDFFIPVCTLGIDSIIVNELIMKPKHTEELLGSGIGIRCITSILSMASIQILLFCMDRGNYLLMWVALLQSGRLLFQCFDLIELWYQSKMEAKYISIVTLAAYLVTAAYKVLLLVLGKSVAWFAFSQTLDYLLIAVMYVILYTFRDKKRFVFQWKYVAGLLKNSYEFILSALMANVYAQMDKIMLGEMLDDEAVGLYSVGTAICSMWVFVLAAVINSVRPSVISAKKNGKEEVYQERLIQMYAIVFWSGIIVSVFFCIFAQLIIKVLYGAEYMGAKSAFQIITWNTGLSYLGVARATWLVCENKQKYEKVLSGLGAAANLMMNAVLIPVWGICGAAVATLVTQLLTSIVIPFFFKDLKDNSILILKAIIYPVKVLKKVR